MRKSKTAAYTPSINAQASVDTDGSDLKTEGNKKLTNEILLKMREKFSNKEGKLIYKLRSQTIETVFGIIKDVIGFRGFRLRGLEKMADEWELACLAYNCKRLHKMLQVN